MADEKNPIEIFILSQIKHFGEESIRLKNKAPIEKIKAIIDAFMLIRISLGTLQHDVGLDC